MKIDASKLRALVKAHGLTNTKLAAQAGITRQALQGILSEDHVVEVRERTVKGLTQALRLPDASLLSPDPLVGYKEAVAAEHADLSLRGLGLPTTELKSIDALYVESRVIRMPEQERDRDCESPTAEGEEGPIEESDKLTVAQCLALHRRVLLCGEPGSGKTTALRHAARAYARGLAAEAGYPNTSRVPLMVRLAEFAKARERDGDTTLIRFLVTRTLRDASPEYWGQVEHHIERELRRGTCLVLLDGLDEIGCDSTLSTALRRFVEDFGRNQFVLTSRLVGLNAGPWRTLGFARFQVARWRDQAIQEFGQRWYGGGPTSGRKLPKKQLEQRANEFTTAILSHPPLREIASNPLMLTILAGLHYANATLPRRRSDLYAKIVDVMLESWEASKREARPGDPLHGIVLEAREFGWLLARLALSMQREGRVLRPRWWVNDLVQQFLREQLAREGDLVKEQTERVIRFLCERTGLLVERGDGLFGFPHRTFQEYFAARGLLLEVDGGGDIVALLRPYLFHPQWEEVVVHVAALLSAPRATTLVRVILDDSDPAGRFLRRGQRLGLRCLVDGAAVADRALLDQIFSNGEVIGKSRWLGIAIECIGLLKQLLVTQHEAEAERMRHEIEEGAKQLPEADYLIVYSSSQDWPDEPRNCAPGTVCRKCLGGRWVKLVRVAWRKRIEDPDAWYEEALKSVRDPGTDLQGRIVLISLLGEESDSCAKVQRVLKERLVRDESPAVRAACAEALQEAVSANSAIMKLLLDRLQREKSEYVRGRCAGALRGVAPSQTDVRTRLEELFTSGPELIRAGAARGLSRVDLDAPAQRALLERFVTTIASPDEPRCVRCESIWAIASLLGKDEMATVNQVVEACLDDRDPNVSSVALHVLADALAEGRMEWSQPLVEKTESLLMAVTDPCPHLFGDLMTIVAMKEIHGGRRLERVLADALTSFGDLVRMAFVFGSVARVEQVQDSDIDLMVIGDVRLKELAAALHTVEQPLGRPVNPVLFSAANFREQYREGNPFLLDVARKEKIFLKGSPDEFRELVADRSPD